MKTKYEYTTLATNAKYMESHALHMQLTSHLFFYPTRKIASYSSLGKDNISIGMDNKLSNYIKSNSILRSQIYITG